MKHEGLKKGIYILPNLFTTANLFCGFFAVIRAINGDYVAAAWAILFAGVFDFLDGRMARLTHTQSEFGLAYDSLVDLGSFGLAPALLVYTWALSYFNRFGWTAAFLFVACGALRLARFNVQAESVEKKHFQGLPIPGAAYFLASFLILYSHVFGEIKPDVPARIFVLLSTFVLAVLMVSNVPYKSFKGLDHHRRAHFFFLVLLVGGLFIMASAPQIMIFVATLVYVVVGIAGEIIRSPKRIKTFADFMVRFFQAHPANLVMDDPEEKTERPLKVVEMGRARDTDL